MYEAIKRFIWKLRTRKSCKCTAPYYEVIDSKLYCRLCRKALSEFKPEGARDA